MAPGTSVAHVTAPQALPRDKYEHYAYTAAFIGCLGQVVSIALAHASLGVALACLTLSRERFRTPPVMAPLIGFTVWTLLSIAVSGDPLAGWPQVKKLALLLAVPLIVYSLFRTVGQIRRLMEGMFVVMLAASLTAIVQFIWKVGEAYEGGYSFIQGYEGRRITGFFSHWITFSEVLLLLSLMLAAYVLLGKRESRSGRRVWLGVGAVLALTLVLSYTRGVWAAVLPAGAYLVWNWRPRLLWVAPAVLMLVVSLAPGSVQERMRSLADPNSYDARVVMWRTGMRMIDANPWFGVGPQLVGSRFHEFQPVDVVERPLGYYGHLHNMPIHYAAERGIPAAILLLWFLLKVLWDHASAAQQARRRGAELTWLLHGVAAATVGVMVVGLSDIALGDSEMLGVYLTLVAVGYRAIELNGGTANPAS